MIEIIIDIFCKIFFGKIYKDGFVDEVSSIDGYTLTSVFPNEQAKKLVNDSLRS